MRRWSILTAAAIGMFWIGWWLIAGEMPTGEPLSLEPLIPRTSPVSLPRILDLLAGFIWPPLIIGIGLSELLNEGRGPGAFALGFTPFAVLLSFILLVAPPILGEEKVLTLEIQSLLAFLGFVIGYFVGADAFGYKKDVAKETLRTLLMVTTPSIGAGSFTLALTSGVLQGLLGLVAGLMAILPPLLFFAGLRRVGQWVARSEIGSWLSAEK